MTKHRYSKQEVEQAVQTSYSIAQTLTKLNLSPKGGNYRVFNKFIKEHSIDISHFKGQAWCKNKKFGPKRPLEDYLSNLIEISSYKLKNRLLKEKIFNHICSNCQLTTWLDNPIPLELDHIDGNHKNNKLNNLRLLCPNCHSLTDTYRGKNQKRCKKV